MSDPWNDEFNPYVNSEVPNPCGKDCPDRAAGCGVVCWKWAEYVEKRNAVYAKRAKAAGLRATPENHWRMQNRKLAKQKQKPGRRKS